MQCITLDDFLVNFDGDTRALDVSSDYVCTELLAWLPILTIRRSDDICLLVNIHEFRFSVHNDTFADISMLCSRRDQEEEKEDAKATMTAENNA